MTRTGFTIVAIGNVDSDQCPDVWSVDDTGKIVHIVRDNGNVYLEDLCTDCPWAIRRTWIQKVLEENVSDGTLRMIPLLGLIVSLVLMLITAVFVSSFKKRIQAEKKDELKK